jgi:hypothetical protein
MRFEARKRQYEHPINRKGVFTVSRVMNSSSDLMDGPSADSIGKIRAIGAVGYEPTDGSASNSGGLPSGQNSGAACSTAVGAENAPPKGGLQTVIDAWPSLPQSAKEQILATIRAARGQ